MRIFDRRFVWLAAALAVLAAGCNDQPGGEPTAQTSPAQVGSDQGVPDQRVAVAVPDAVAPDVAATIRIASFNIQVFGTSKERKTAVMDVLAKVVRRFDAVAIQEVRAKDDQVVPRFVERINADGARYDFVIGPRLGRTSSKEQYAVIFNTARIEVDRRSVYTVADPQDLFQREPTVASFRVLGPPPGQAFTFSLADIHTEPDEAAAELDALADVFVGIQHNGSGEDDVILLGDLNADEYHFGRLGRLPGIAHAITGVTTNTRGTHMYDNIIFDRRPTVEYTGRAGVLNLMTEYNLSLKDALEVSDHFPVWAEFSAYEGAGTGTFAARPGVEPKRE